VVPLVVGLSENGAEAPRDRTLIWAGSCDQVVGAVFLGVVDDQFRA